jgi:hypothetical protein
VSDGTTPGPHDRVNRGFKAPRPNLLRVAGFTDGAIWTGVVDVAFVIDAFARRIVGGVGDSHDRELVGHVPPAEAEASTHRSREEAVGTTRHHLRETPCGSRRVLGVAPTAVEPYVPPGGRGGEIHGYDQGGGHLRVVRAAAGILGSRGTSGAA